MPIYGFCYLIQFRGSTPVARCGRLSVFSPAARGGIPTLGTRHGGGRLRRFWRERLAGSPAAGPASPVAVRPENRLRCGDFCQPLFAGSAGINGIGNIRSFFLASSISWRWFLPSGFSISVLEKPRLPRWNAQKNTESLPHIPLAQRAAQFVDFVTRTS